MKPVSPVVKGFEQYEFSLAKDQPEYEPIPTLLAEGEEARFVSRWEFSDLERQQIYEGASLILQQLTFGHPFQPVSLQIVTEEEINGQAQV